MKRYKRIVVKVGTSTLTHTTGKLNFCRIEKLVRVLSDFNNMGYEVVLVSSGAMGVGVGKLNLKTRPKTIMEKQAVSAVGQSELMGIYDRFFMEYGQTISQILLTKDDIGDRQRKENLSNTFLQLLKYNCIPIVNENDSISYEEIEFGDNDTLSAIVAKLVEADLLVMLTDIDGLYDKNPRKFSDAKIIDEVAEITEEIKAMADGAGTSRGTGGMITKLLAAEIATNAGCDVIIANGSAPGNLYQILEGEPVGTKFRRMSHE